MAGDELSRFWADKLVILLSTDWFEPYWAVIGINADPAARSSIRQGCRQIVTQILSGAESYYLISFSEERISETISRLRALAESVGADDVIGVLEEGMNRSDEDEKATWLWLILTDELLKGNVETKPLDAEIREAIAQCREKSAIATWEFMHICMDSKTAWDKYTRGLTPEQPTAIADYLGGFLTPREFEGLWARLQRRLSAQQRAALVAWYRDTGRARTGRDLCPVCVSREFQS